MEIKSPPCNHLGMCTVQLFNNALYAAPSGPLIFLNVSLRVLSRSALFVRSLDQQSPEKQCHHLPEEKVTYVPVTQ